MQVNYFIFFSIIISFIIICGKYNENTESVNGFSTETAVDVWTDCMEARRDESRFEQDVAEQLTAGPGHMWAVREQWTEGGQAKERESNGSNCDRNKSVESGRESRREACI